MKERTVFSRASKQADFSHGSAVTDSIRRTFTGTKSFPMLATLWLEKEGADAVVAFFVVQRLEVIALRLGGGHDIVVLVVVSQAWWWCHVTSSTG